jgi:dTDP-4-dehydrorhamnose 3,5-epimerase
MDKKVKLTPLGIDGAWLAESPVWEDNRGFFREWFRAESFENVIGRSFNVEQANISVSSAGALRGIHYSLAPGGQAKWITCVVGLIQDVIVDIRQNSRTFGEWIDIELEGNSGKALLLSEGLGHAFLALENETVVSYLVTSNYSPADEYEINPLDSALGIRWGMETSRLKVSEKDWNAPTLEERLKTGTLPYFSTKS